MIKQLTEQQRVFMDNVVTFLEWIEEHHDVLVTSFDPANNPPITKADLHYLLGEYLGVLPEDTWRTVYQQPAPAPESEADEESANG